MRAEFVKLASGVEAIISRLEPVVGEVDGISIKLYPSTKLVGTSYGAWNGERQRIPTGGVQIELSLPQPAYAPREPITARLPPPWTVEQLARRVETLHAKALAQVELDKLRDRVYAAILAGRASDEWFDPHFEAEALSTGREAAVEAMSREECEAWEAWIAGYTTRAWF